MPKDTTQEQFAKLVGITQPAVSQLIRKGVLTRGQSIGRWLQEYISNLREQAAAHKSDEGQDIIKERARLAARQSEKLEIETARLRGELIPRQAVADILGFHNSTIRSRLLAIPARLKSQHPELQTSAVVALKILIDETLTELSHVRFPSDIDEQTRQYFSDLHSTTKPNGDAVGR